MGTEMLNKDSLHPYQKRAVEWIKSHEQAALWLDMGLGKTISTLTAFTDLLGTFDCRRMLVIAPLRVARKVWSDEVRRWSHTQGLSISPIVGTRSERLAALKTPADIHTINRENCMWLEEQFIQGHKQVKRWPWDMVVLDESQSFKNADTERFKSIRRLRRLMTRVVTLTGTPAPNGLHDLWAQYFLLDRGERLGATLGAFRQRWFTAIKNPDMPFTRWESNSSAKDSIWRAVADITLSLRAEDYLDLPPVQNNFVRVTLEPAMLAKYKKLERDCYLEFKDETITAVNAGALGQKLLQLANGAVYVNERDWKPLHDDKLTALTELLDGISGKALIGYAFRHDLARLEGTLNKFCADTGKKWALLRSDDSFTRWANGEYDYGVLHPASAGHGLNDVYKSGAEDLIWFGLTNNLEYYQQLNARLTGGHRRAGRNVIVHHIVCEDTVDVEMIELLGRKDATQQDLTRVMANHMKEVV